MTAAPAYVARLNTQREILDVVEGKALFGIPYCPGEREALERRARQLGGPDVAEVLVALMVRA